MHCPQVDIKYLSHLWKSEMRSDQICEHLGVTRGHLYHLVRKHRLGRRPPQLNAPNRVEAPDPTEQQIAEMTAAIRATWTEEERKSRIAGCYRRQRVEIVNYVFDRTAYSFSS